MQQLNSSITHTTYQTLPDVTWNEPKTLTVVLMDATAAHTAAISFDGTNDAVSLLSGVYPYHKFENRLVNVSKIWIKAGQTSNVQLIAE